MKRMVIASLAVAAILGGFTPAMAQAPAPTPDPSVRMTVPTPTRPPGIRLEPTMPRGEQRIREQEWFPGLIYGRHEPAFIIPWVTTVATSPTSSMRVGFSAWTAPALPFDQTEGASAPALGLTIMWGGPPVESRPPDRPTEPR
ncbi:MAG TPA: hypothetical protein VLD61_11880 [Methylomirabilota bacterium]|nr:hypothetical protein [Methylomirabilota bacterium]